jgi:hypothetical protein
VSRNTKDPAAPSTRQYGDMRSPGRPGGRPADAADGPTPTTTDEEAVTTPDGPPVDPSPAPAPPGAPEPGPERLLG